MIDLWNSIDCEESDCIRLKYYCGCVRGVVDGEGLFIAKLAIHNFRCEKL